MMEMTQRTKTRYVQAYIETGIKKAGKILRYFSTADFIQFNFASVSLLGYGVYSVIYLTDFPQTCP